MDGQPSVIPASAAMSTVMLGGHLPPTDQYSTFIHVFPGNNAHPPWVESGYFQFEAVVYVKGREAGRVRSGVCDEKGNLKVELNAAAESGGGPAGGMYVVEFRHAKGIPVEVYAFHVHKATGTYVSCNVTTFIGDQLYPKAHSDQMENTQFWPGIVADEDNEPYAVVVNPYDTAMAFQVHLFASGQVVARSGTLRLKPKVSEEVPLCRLFEDEVAGIRGGKWRHSFCIASQYKLISYFMLKNRTHKAIAMMDHLHNFCLA